MGLCRQCGKCCRLKNLLQATALSTAAVSDNEATCTHLVELDNGSAICSIFGKRERPLACSLHPNSPASLTDDECGYFFVFTDS